MSSFCIIIFIHILCRSHCSRMAFKTRDYAGSCNLTGFPHSRERRALVIFNWTCNRTIMGAVTKQNSSKLLSQSNRYLSNKATARKMRIRSLASSTGIGSASASEKAALPSVPTKLM